MSNSVNCYARSAPLQAIFGLAAGLVVSSCVSPPAPDSLGERTAVASAELAAGVGAPCVPGLLALAVTPAEQGPLAAQETAVYDVVGTDTDSVTCEPRSVLFAPGPAPSNFSIFADSSSAVLEPGDNVHFVMSVTANTEAAPGSYSLPFRVLTEQPGGGPSANVTFDLAAEEGCFVRPARELFVSDVSVVDDPVRTVLDDASGDSRSGAWTFGRLMRQMAPSEKDAPAFVERLFSTWLADQTLNGFTVSARPSVAPFLLEPWPRSLDGSLDLTRAPLRLLAIVNRIDDHDQGSGPAGEGRFVFDVLENPGIPSPFTLIVEYHLPVAGEGGVRAWADAWHGLGSLPFPSEEYNAALQAITDRFVARGVDPFGPNGSALASVRTDDFALGEIWELRQFKLSYSGGSLEEATVDLTPDNGFVTGSSLLADFVNRYERDVLRADDFVPLRFEGQPFRGGSALNEMIPWQAQGIRNPEARRDFALQTCNGCHSIPETGTGFLHVSPRAVGTPATLSGFVLGMAMPDPFTGELRVFNDLGRRKAYLERLVCPQLPKGRRRAVAPARVSHPTSRDTP